MISLRQVVKRYPLGDSQITALDRVSAEISAGDLIAVTGPSGCGKSTLLNVIGHLVVPDSGEVSVAGQPVGRRSDRALARLRNEMFGYVFQDYALIESGSVADNVALPLHYAAKRMPARERRGRVLDAIAEVGLDEFADQRVSRLSGGQRQRVAVARALVNRPALILADEPTGSLDSENASQVMDLLTGLPGDGRAVLIVTHSPELASRCPIRWQMRDGRLTL